MKVFLHPDIQNFRGRLLNAVYQVAASGIQVKRNYVTPFNPQSQYQQQVRSSFGTLAGDWLNVSGAQRDGWAALAASYERFNPNGTSYPMTALSAFIMVNMFRAMDGQALTLDAPDFPSIGSIAFPQLTYDHTADQLSITMFDLDVGSFLYKVRLNLVTPEPYVLSFEKARFPTIDPADSILPGTPSSLYVTINIPLADMRPEFAAWDALADGTYRVGINVQKLSTDYAPQTTRGQYVEADLVVDTI